MLPAGTVISTSGGMTRLIWTESEILNPIALVPVTVIGFTPWAKGKAFMVQLVLAGAVPVPPVRLLVQRRFPLTTKFAVPWTL